MRTQTLGLGLQLVLPFGFCRASFGGAQTKPLLPDLGADKFDPDAHCLEHAEDEAEVSPEPEHGRTGLGAARHVAAHLLDDCYRLSRVRDQPAQEVHEVTFGVRHGNGIRQLVATLVGNGSAGSGVNGKYGFHVGDFNLDF